MPKNNANDQHICEEIVTKIAKLARLRLTAAEATRYQTNFTELLLLFHELDDIDITKKTTIDVHLQNAEDCREDLPILPVHEQLSRACPHYNPNSAYFDVPKFIEYDNE